MSKLPTTNHLGVRRAFRIPESTEPYGPVRFRLYFTKFFIKSLQLRRHQPCFHFSMLALSVRCPSWNSWLFRNLDRFIPFYCHLRTLDFGFDHIYVWRISIPVIKRHQLLITHWRLKRRASASTVSWRIFDCIQLGHTLWL